MLTDNIIAVVYGLSIAFIIFSVVTNGKLSYYYKAIGSMYEGHLESS